MFSLKTYGKMYDVIAFYAVIRYIQLIGKSNNYLDHDS